MANFKKIPAREMWARREEQGTALVSQVRPGRWLWRAFPRPDFAEFAEETAGTAHSIGRAKRAASIALRRMVA